MYVPRTAPTKADDVPSYLQTELQKIAQEWTASVDTVGYRVVSSPPARPRDGMTIVSSGDPSIGDGRPGLHTYVAGVWYPSDTSGWREWTRPVEIRSAGVNTGGYIDPIFDTYRGNIKQFRLIVGGAAQQEWWTEFLIDHDYKPSSDIYINVHWSQNVVDTGGTAGAPGAVKFFFEVSYAKGHNQAAFSAPVTTSVIQTASATQYQHMIAEVQLSAASPSGSQLDSDNLEADGMLLVRAYRHDAEDTLNQYPFVHSVGIHYQTNITATPNKAPPFA